MKKLSLICLAVTAFVFSRSARATELFSDFGPANAYNCCDAWNVSGIGAFGESEAAAEAFTVAGSGADIVSQIDIAIGQEQSGSGYFVSIWSDNASLPGTEVSGAYWGGLSPSGPFGACCNVTSITGISGVTLTGGDTYFMVVGPMDPSGSAWYGWNWNSIGLNTLDVFSNDGGTIWSLSEPSFPASAFDVVGSAATPEPSTFLLLASGLVGWAGMVRRRCARA